MRLMRTSTFTKARSALCLLALAGALLAALAAGVSPAGAGGKDVTAVVNVASGVTRLSIDDSIEGGDVVPGWTLPLRELFK